MSNFVVQLKTPCQHERFECSEGNCPKFVYTEVDLATALKAVLRENPSLANEIVRLAGVK